MTSPSGIRKVTTAEVEKLQDMCRKSYASYFADHWVGNGLESYLEEQFGTKRLQADLRSEHIDYLFICHQDQPVGFIKINRVAIFEEAPSHTACELEKMYVLLEYKGKGLGKTALSSLIGTLAAQGNSCLFLDVLDTNHDARKFYERFGFTFHSKVRLQYPTFKEDLRGLDRLFLDLAQVRSKMKHN